MTAGEPTVYGRPMRIDGRYYADGGLVDNVPYEAALEAGCERALVVIPDPREEPLPVGRVTTTVDGVMRCIDAGHRAAERALGGGRIS